MFRRINWKFLFSRTWNIDIMTMFESLILFSARSIKDLFDSTIQFFYSVAVAVAVLVACVTSFVWLPIALGVRVVLALLHMRTDYKMYRELFKVNGQTQCIDDVIFKIWHIRTKCEAFPESRLYRLLLRKYYNYVVRRAENADEILDGIAEYIYGRKEEVKDGYETEEQEKSRQRTETNDF